MKRKAILIKDLDGGDYNKTVHSIGELRRELKQLMGRRVDVLIQLRACYGDFDWYSIACGKLSA